MSRIFFTFFLTSVICLNGNAQSAKFQKLSENDDYRWIEITFSNGIKKQGLLRDKNVIQRYLRIVFYDSLANKTVYKPTDLIGYRLKGRIFMADTASNTFYELVDKGLRLSLFKIQSKPTYTTSHSLEKSFDGVNLTETSEYKDLGILYFYYHKKKKEFFPIPLGEGFYNMLGEFLKDCPELSKKIINKDFDKNQLQAIMNVYNFRCEF